MSGERSSPFGRPGKLKEVLAKFPETACLRARLINPALKQQPLLSRDRALGVVFEKDANALFCIDGTTRVADAPPATVLG